MTEKLDLKAAKAHANERVLQIIRDGTLEIPDNRDTTITQNTKAIMKWLFENTYFPVWDKWIGWSVATFEAGLWPGDTQAATLADKLELISRGLTQTKNSTTGKFDPKPIREAFRNRLEYFRKKQREYLQIPTKVKGNISIKHIRHN